MNTHVDCQTIQLRLREWFEATVACRVAGDNLWLVSTPFLRPHRGIVQLLLEELPSGDIRISDGGDGLSQLELDGVDISLSSVTERIEEVADELDLTLTDGEVVGFTQPSGVGVLASRIAAALAQIDVVASQRPPSREPKFTTQLRSLLKEGLSDLAQVSTGRADLPASRRQVTASVEGSRESAYLDAVTGTGYGDRSKNLFGSAWKFSHEPELQPWQKVAVLKSYGSEWSRVDLFEAAESCFVVTWDHRNRISRLIQDVVNGGHQFPAQEDRVLA